MTIFEELQWRGLVNQSSDETKINEITKHPITVYAGFDPTADSLHIGNLIPLIALMRFQKAGHHPIAVAGGGTGMIGDPSGKDEERKLNTSDIVADWTSKIRSQLEHFLDFNNLKNPAILVNNYDWISSYNLITYLRDIGKYFSVNWMLSKDSVQLRIGNESSGISYTEFSYMIIQALDFYHLHKTYGCTLQIGGSDQWGNMTAGMELIRKKTGEDSYSLTFPLILTSTGKKFGKTEKGTVWLDSKRTTPYQFYQFWYNTNDADVIRFLKYFTFLDKATIDTLENRMMTEPQEREAQKALAEEMTKLVHGEKELQKALKASKILFGSIAIKGAEEDVLETLFNSKESHIFTYDASLLVDILIKVKLSTSKREARQDIESGAISLNGDKIKNINYSINDNDFLFNRYLVVRKGQKKLELLIKSDNGK